MIKIDYLALLVAGFVVCSNVVAGQDAWDRGAEIKSKSLEITVYRSSTCRCCKGWIEHLEKHNFKVKDVQTSDMATVKDRLGVPERMGSCHTATINGYLIEGHVPAQDIRRLVKESPDLTGLAVPQMPVGTPGMAMGNRKDPFAVLGFKRNGDFQVFNEYWDY